MSKSRAFPQKRGSILYKIVDGENPKSKPIIFLNGKFLSPHEAKVSVLQPGFLYGWGLFETMRSYNEKIIYLKRHLNRIRNSCRLINIHFPYSIRQLEGAIKKAIKLSSIKDAYIRLTLWKEEKGTGTLIIVKKYNPYPNQKYKKGFQACISAFRQNENSILTQLKSANYLLHSLAYQQAKEKGLDEAVMLNSRGYVAEGSRSNIFLIKGKELLTPSLESGCLNGVTRGVILDLSKKYNIRSQEGNYTLKDLSQADEAFFTNSLIGVMPLVSLERGAIGDSRCGRLTKFFIEKYACLLK